jgi:hypothetical protein
MKTPTQHFKKAFMWYKVNELHSKGLNKSQISKEPSFPQRTFLKISVLKKNEK